MKYWLYSFVVKYIPIDYFKPNSLYFLIPYAYLPFLLPTGNSDLFPTSVSLLLLCYIHYFIVFLDSTYKWYHTVFAFLCLIYFT